MPNLITLVGEPELIKVASKRSCDADILSVSGSENGGEARDFLFIGERRDAKYTRKNGEGIYVFNPDSYFVLEGIGDKNIEIGYCGRPDQLDVAEKIFLHVDIKIDVSNDDNKGIVAVERKPVATRLQVRNLSLFDNPEEVIKFLAEEENYSPPKIPEG